MDALSNQRVDAIVVAGAAAIAGGTVAVGLAGAGASSENRIGADVRAYIDGDGASGISVDSVALNADDMSTINADTGAVSVAASFGMFGASVSVGVALAANEIDNQVEAYIKNADNLTTTVGGVTVTSPSVGASS